MDGNVLLGSTDDHSHDPCDTTFDPSGLSLCDGREIVIRVEKF